MKTFFALLAICAGNSPVTPVNSPHKGQWQGALMLSLICAWINGWVNNREAGDLRRHRAHYDVTVLVYDRIIIITMPITDGLVQERRNSSALAIELRFSCPNTSIWCGHKLRLGINFNNPSTWTQGLSQSCELRNTSFLSWVVCIQI